MSSVFKSPKVVNVQPVAAVPEVVDDSEVVYELEKKRKKKMGAVSQFLSRDNTYGGFLNGPASGEKRTLGE